MDDVADRAKAAGLKATHSIQRLEFSSTLNERDYRLVEIPENLIESLRDGEHFAIRGDPSEDAVLCTRSQSYEIKVVDVSNTMLLAPSLGSEGDVAKGEVDPLFVPFLPSPRRAFLSAKIPGVANCYYELKRCQPRLEKLDRILKDCAYKGPDEEKASTNKGYLVEELLREVQASEDEVELGLRQRNAFCVNLRWRVLDDGYEERVVMAILGLIDDKQWSYAHLRVSEVYAELAGDYPPFVLKHCLDCYGFQKNEDPDFYSLNELKVCQFYGEYLLKAAGKFSYEDFMNSWQQSVPSGMTTDISQLKGLALWDLDAQPPVIWHYAARDLPRNATQRFATLFKTKPKWRLEDLEPYISDLASDKQSMNALLLKYARTSTDNRGGKLYNSKRPL
ncbi:sister chromatid cohesion protein DCC1-like isoform X2 [Oscarella lobularis]|uniref:sister chromatid cohesion protein DCC1-like isoform X2 n=1 Tax=Oscarella lobularis TaxID=121494 RepID=UPI003313D7EA